MNNYGTKFFLMTEDQFRYFYYDFVERTFLEEVVNKTNYSPPELKAEMKDWVLKSFIALFLEGDIHVLVLKCKNSYAIFSNVFDLLERAFPLVFGRNLDDFVEERLNFVATHVRQ